MLCGCARRAGHWLRYWSRCERDCWCHHRLLRVCRFAFLCAHEPRVVRVELGDELESRREIDAQKQNEIESAKTPEPNPIFRPGPMRDPLLPGHSPSSNPLNLARFSVVPFIWAAYPCRHSKGLFYLPPDTQCGLLDEAYSKMALRSSHQH